MTRGGDSRRGSGRAHLVQPFSVRVLVLLAAHGQAFDFDLPLRGRRLAEVEGLRLHGGGGPSRLLISLTARATGRGAARHGTWGGCSQRLCWDGAAPARRVRSRLRRQARRADWRLTIFPAFIREVSISARVDDVERLPDSLEAAFGVP